MVMVMVIWLWLWSWLYGYGYGTYGDGDDDDVDDDASDLLMMASMPCRTDATTQCRVFNYRILMGNQRSNDENNSSRAAPQITFTLWYDILTQLRFYCDDACCLHSCGLALQTIFSTSSRTRFPPMVGGPGIVWCPWA